VSAGFLVGAPSMARSASFAWRWITVERKRNGK
jgi:hypothetical protein